MDAKELDAHRSPIPGREVWVVSAWVDGRAWPEVVSFAHDHIVSLSLEGRVVTVELEADGERRRHEWRFDGMNDALANYDRLATILTPDWPPRPLGSYGSIRTRPSETTTPEAGPIVIIRIQRTDIRVVVTDIPRIDIDTWNDIGRRSITIPVRPGFTARRVGEAVYYGDLDFPLASLTFTTVNVADIHFRALCMCIAQLKTAADWHRSDLMVTYQPEPEPEPEDPTTILIDRVTTTIATPLLVDRIRIEGVRGEHGLHHMLDIPLADVATITLNETTVAFATADGTHVGLVGFSITQNGGREVAALRAEACFEQISRHLESGWRRDGRTLVRGATPATAAPPTAAFGPASLEPVDQARRWIDQIDQGEVPAAAICTIRADDLRQLLVDALQERCRVAADTIVVNRLHHNELLRIRNILQDAVWATSQSTVGRMIAAAYRAENEDEMFRIEDVR